MEKRTTLISSRVKGQIREAAWEESIEVEWTKEERLRLSLAGRGVPRRDLKKLWIIEALAVCEKVRFPSLASRFLIWFFWRRLEEKRWK
jgi:hypothetical protein